MDQKESGLNISDFTHINKQNEVYMIDITEKDVVPRNATASGTIYLRKETIRAIKNGDVVKGNVLGTAKIAGIMAVKQTSSLIPMCHPIPINGVDITFKVLDEKIDVMCTVKTSAKTGIEMEAITGVLITLDTIWDMVKSVEKDERGQYPVTRIDNVHVIEKNKGI